VGGSVTDAAMSIWKSATSRLFDLESRIVMQVGRHMLPQDSVLCTEHTAASHRGCTHAE
jgi:hypothetical protein